jgi:hypothetical protein
LYSSGRDFGEFLRWFLIAHFEDREDVLVAFTRGFQRVDIFVKFGASGGVFWWRRGSCLSGTDVLGTVGGGCGGARGRSVATIGGIVAFLPASEAKSVMLMA